MNANTKIFKAILFFVGILLIAGYGSILYLNLDEPVFLDHYYDLQVNGGDDDHDLPFNLNYITNADDERVVIGVTFPDYPDIRIQASENYFPRTNSFQWNEPFNREIGRTFGRYSVRTVYLQIRNLSGVDELNNAAISEATLFFSDSTEMTVDVGEIRLHTEEVEDQLLEQLYGYSSPDGVVEASYRVHQDISLSSIDHHTGTNDTATEIKVNEVDHTGADEIVISEGDILGIRTAGEPSGNKIDEYKLTNTYPEITLTTTDGDEQSFKIPNFHDVNPEYTFMGIFSYLRERGEI